MSLSINEANDILRERYEFFTENINAGNINKAVTEYYTDSAYATGHEAPLFAGHEALIKLFEEIHAENKGIRIDIVDTRVAGDTCIYSLVTATSRLTATNDEATIKSLLVWRKQNSEWRCDADIFALGGF